MENRGLNWILFALLSFIWGSSFILMKAGMMGLTPFQVASVRIVASGLCLLPILFKAIKLIPKNKIGYVFFSGLLGSMLPSYLFCIAEMKIDSALAGTLNALTPVFAIITGALFFKNLASTQKIVGVLIAFSGCVMLFLSHPNMAKTDNWSYAFLILIATIMYGYNVNLVQRHLKGIPSLEIVSMALALNAIPALLVLCFTGFFNLDFSNTALLVSTGYACLLGAMGTALANILFYILIKRSGVFFSSMVTYGIPFVAIMWGVVLREKTGWLQIGSLLVILFGVYWANKKQLEEKNG